MKGQYTDTEFINMLNKAGIWNSSVNYVDKTAYITTGRTTNFYYQCEDGSWFNYNCKTT